MKQTDIAPLIAGELGCRPVQVEKTIELLDGGNTVPFIARYRKEVTGSLEDEQIRTIEERLNTLRNLVKRQEEILARIDEQGKLTPDLRQAIEQAQKLTELEDLYLPYKQKRRTRAQQAREKGLEPLANAFLKEPGISWRKWLRKMRTCARTCGRSCGRRACCRRNWWKTPMRPRPS